VLTQGLFLNPHKPEVGSSSLPFDTKTHYFRH